jgi:GST-like protein
VITLYGGPTPNARKIAIALEELSLPWDFVFVDIMRGDQLAPEFLKLNPNNKTPVIVDGAGPGGRFVLWETGAILLYLAERTGKLVPAEPAARAICHQWLMFQVSGVGPMVGQNAHFQFYAKDKHPYAIERYSREVDRLLKVLEGRLAESRYLAGEAYTVADIATYPYVQRQLTLRSDELPSMARWGAELAARPAVQRGMEVGRSNVRPETIEGGLKGLTDEHRSILFGDRQFTRGER